MSRDWRKEQLLIKAARERIRLREKQKAEDKKRRALRRANQLRLRS